MTFIGPVLNDVTVVTCERAVTNLINDRRPALRGEPANVELSLFGARRHNATVWCTDCRLDQFDTTEDCRLDQLDTTEDCRLDQLARHRHHRGNSPTVAEVITEPAGDYVWNEVEW